METKQGKVKYFNPKDYHGMIIVDGLDKDVYVNTQDINEDAINLIKDEEVTFELVPGSLSGSYAAKNLNRLNRRYTGIILNYDDGKGVVKCHQNNDEYSIYYKDFINTNLESMYEFTRIKIESGDEIEFNIEEDNRYGSKAIKIYYDGRKALSRFAAFPIIDSKLAYLAKISPEPWDYLNSDPDNNFLPVLRNYIFYTFGRLRKEEKIYNVKRILYSKTESTYHNKKTHKTEKKEI